MATDEEKKKQGLQSYQDFNVPGPQASANQALGNVANQVKKGVVGPPSIVDRVKGIGSQISTGFNQAAESLSNWGNKKIQQSADTVRAGERLTKAAPIFGSTQPGRDIATGLGDAAKTAFTGPQSLLGVSRKVVGAGADLVGPALERVASDYQANEERFGRNIPDPQGTGEVAAGTPQNAEQAATDPTLQAEQGGTANTRILSDDPKRPRLKMTNNGIMVATPDGDRPARPEEIEAFRNRVQAGIPQQPGSLGQAAGASPVQQVGNMDVQFDPSVSPEARAAFMKDPVRPTAQIDRGPRPAGLFGATQVPAPRVAGPGQGEQEPQYVTRETHPDITGEAATAINRAIAQGHQNRQSLGVTGANRLDQIGASGQQSIDLAKQYGLNTLANTQLAGEHGNQGDLAKQSLKGQQDMLLEQYKQQNAEQFEFIEPQFDKKGNQLPGTGLHIPKNPYDLGKVDPKNLKTDQLIKLNYLQEQQELTGIPMYDQIMQKYGITE